MERCSGRRGLLAKQGYIRHRQLDEELPSPVPHPDYPDCIIDTPEWVGDGFCDAVSPYNTPECGYDGGDCCVGTCQDGALLMSAEWKCRSTVRISISAYNAPVTTQPPEPHPDYPDCFVDIPELLEMAGATPMETTIRRLVATTEVTAVKIHVLVARMSVESMHRTFALTPRSQTSD